MKRTLNWLGTMLIVSGIMLFVFLMDGNVKSEERQRGMIDAFRSVQVAEETAVLPEFAKDETVNLEEMEGILSIPAIDLEAPVLYGADAATLDKSLGAIENMDLPGEMDGSYAIAGHQAHVLGRFFNRLHEMKIGNEFTFQTADEEMVFKVFDIQIVKPNEVDVLKPQEGKALISLITCYPAYSNEYRLVVQGERVE
ncbi:class D sortase [Sporosarcina sp. ACRSL]|uniref:class D sortase n=1 Tax=Sporosarcina sp. ACRSL TaxID=2918215 RepID=UPI001EF5A4BE|nr:class D sortase [Sporosarcina sp. ACRSL]MCG7346586.1 class D sortase [Sporosarcina sp. ACRSL]